MINLELCEKAIKDIYVRGTPDNSGRLHLIEEAIGYIQQDGGKFLDSQYLGIKNYANFGDQRTDCEYGYGPKHGSIVFEIGKTREGRNKPLGNEHIYLLECIRDFGMFEDEFDLSEHYPQNKKIKNFYQLITRYLDRRYQLNYYKNLIEKATVESVLLS